MVENNQTFFGEVGKRMVMGLMTKAEKVRTMKGFCDCGGGGGRGSMGLQRGGLGPTTGSAQCSATNVFTVTC